MNLLCDLECKADTKHPHVYPRKTPLRKTIYNLFVCKVASDVFAPDVLGTAKEMRVANFRRVLKTVVYGMAQPNSEVKSGFLHLSSVSIPC